MRAGERAHVSTDIGPLPTRTGTIRHDLPDLGVLVAYRDATGFVHCRGMAKITTRLAPASVSGRDIPTA
jgi:hypothetical protein